MTTHRLILAAALGATIGTYAALPGWWRLAPVVVLAPVTSWCLDRIEDAAKARECRDLARILARILADQPVMAPIAASLYRRADKHEP